MVPALPSSRPSRLNCQPFKSTPDSTICRVALLKLLPALMEKSAGSERSVTGLKAYQPNPAIASSVEHSARRKIRLIHDHIRLRAYPCPGNRNFKTL